MERMKISVTARTRNARKTGRLSFGERKKEKGENGERAQQDYAGVKFAFEHGLRF